MLYEVITDASKNTGYMAVDYAFVRKFVDPEPTVTFASAQVEAETPAETISELDSISDTESPNETETPVSEVSVSEEPSEIPAQMEENQSANVTNAPEPLFPRYSVSVSGIKLSSPYRFNFPALSRITSYNVCYTKLLRDLFQNLNSIYFYLYVLISTLPGKNSFF